jgi:hypothetical protein
MRFNKNKNQYSFDGLFSLIKTMHRMGCGIDCPVSSASRTKKE